MAARTLIRRGGIIWIPKVHNFNYKVTITRSDGTVDTVTNDIISLDFSQYVVGEVGSFSAELDNNVGTVSMPYTGGETIKIYLDFVDASELKFEGTLDSVMKQMGDAGNVLKLTGSHVSAVLLDVTVTESYIDEPIEDILDEIVGTYAPDFSYNKTTYPCSTTATINWSNKPFWDCVYDLCELVNFDCYVNNSKAFIFFLKESILNTVEAAIWDDNLYSIEGIGTNIVPVRNKVIVYGEDDEGLPIIYTVEDSSSQSNYKLKEKIIRDSDISTEEQAKERGDAELVLLKQTVIEGMVTTYLLPDVNPGEMMWVSNPPKEIHDIYRIYGFVHKILEDTTECIIGKQRRIPSLFKEGIKKDLENEKIENPNKLDYSYNFTWDDDTDVSTHEDTEVYEGSLQLRLNKTTGTCITNTKTVDSNITYAELRVNGQDFASSDFYISIDSGITWEAISIGSKYDVVGLGNRLKMKIILNIDTENPNPQLKSTALLYS